MYNNFTHMAWINPWFSFQVPSKDKFVYLPLTDNLIHLADQPSIVRFEPGPQSKSEPNHSDTPVFKEMLLDFRGIET